MRLSGGILLQLAGASIHRALGAAVFTWPDPLLHALDDQLYRDGGSVASSSFPLHCALRENSTIAAQWLRIAYHNMATHNRTAGTGGMDASIMFELDRAQNVGDGMLATLIDFLLVPNRYVGMADVLAMGAVNAVVACGGPVIPFRGGRKDATEAGPATVPEPQQDLASHIASFKDQGFSQTEMISLVACGHALGGVRKADFPLVVTEEIPTGIQTFASTVGFDTTVVTEYLDGSTENVLVVGSNVTTRSDLRIFASDGNATMRSLASPDTFNQVCADLIGRMLDTVPSDVTLTDPIEPFDFKVSNTMLFPQGGSLAFLATMRIIDSELNRTVTMFWKERTETFCPPAGCSVPSFQVTTEDATFIAMLKGVKAFNMHSFNASVDLIASISHFWFEVNDNDGSEPFIVDNHGANYTIDQDVLVFDARRSKFTPTTGLSTVIGVKDSSASVSVTGLLTFFGDTNDFGARSVLVPFELDAAHPPADGYTFYSAHIGRNSSIMIDATVNGQAYSMWLPTFSAPGV